MRALRKRRRGDLQCRVAIVTIVRIEIGVDGLD